MTTVKPRFHLPPDYYVRVSPGITLSVVGFLWIVFPIIAFFPNSLDFIINDYFGEILERNSANLVRLFNVQVWVSHKFSVQGVVFYVAQCIQLTINYEIMNPDFTQKIVFDQKTIANKQTKIATHLFCS